MVVQPECLEDLRHWVDTDRKVALKALDLIDVEDRVAPHDEEAVGGIGIHPQTDIFIKNAELGYWLGEPFWDKE